MKHADRFLLAGILMSLLTGYSRSDQPQAIFLEPETGFQLIAPATARKMQKKRALDFFDLTIRADETARSRLPDKRYQADSLTLESRNFQVVAQ